MSVAVHGAGSGVNGEKHGEVAAAPLVYLVDDDRAFRQEIVFGLSGMGLDVHGFRDAAELYRAYAVRPSDIVIIDIGLEGEDGLSMASHLRSSGSVGIIMATGRGSVEDRIEGLRRGADAYLVKPIDLRELAGTIRALSQRLEKRRVPSPPVSPDWELAESGWALSDGRGNRLRLTTVEQRFVGRLFVDRGKTVERHALAEAMGEDIHDYNYGRLDTVASRLRRRAEKARMHLPLYTVRGIGFVFADPNYASDHVQD